MKIYGNKQKVNAVIKKDVDSDLIKLNPDDLDNVSGGVSLRDTEKADTTDINDDTKSKV